ncbi:MAG: heparinase II/III family protein, partial [Gemmatimonadetes bacterium]|nr:heparinase II/III family protein [Gemmatimonadota bacterium]
MSRPPGKGLGPLGEVTLQAGVAAVRDRVRAELRSVPLPRPRKTAQPSQGLAAAPVDLRPADPARGRALLRGSFALAGAVLEVGPGGDPWTPAAPSRRFAVQLHRLAWLPDLLARPEQGPAEALRLVLDHQRLFGRASGFAWSAEVLERRVFNLACGMTALASLADEADRTKLVSGLADQVQALSDHAGSVHREVERLAAAAVGAATLAGRAGLDRLTALLPRLSRALEAAVLPDGGCRSRSPRQGLELLLDLRTLDDALLQRGREAPLALTRAIERLSGATRFFTLADGALASFHGGESAPRTTVEAALESDRGEQQPSTLPQSGYHRLAAGTLQLIADAGAPAAEAWSETACAQPAAFELIAGGDRLFANTGWSSEALGPSALRLPAGANTAAVGDGSPGAPL